MPDNHRLMVYNGRTLGTWHVLRTVVPGERLTEDQKRPVADFQMVGGKWHLINRRLSGMKELTTSKEIPANSMIELTDGQQILLSSEEGGRLIQVQMANA